MNSKRASLGFWATLCLLVAMGCLMQPDREAKRGTEVENQVYGALVDVNGRPVEGASVKAVPAGSFGPANGSAPVESVLTDAAGRYSLRNLAPGVYNLIGNQDNGSLVVLIPGIDHADTTRKQNVGEDTLRAPGGISGRVTLGGRGKEGVIGYLPGTSYLAVTDANGDFLMTGVPEGIYTLNYLVSGLQAAPDSGVRVKSGVVTVMPVKELGYDTTLAPPAPAQPSAVYDTLHGVVTLRWNSVPVADLLGYLVYRDTGSLSAPELLNNVAVADTVFSDTLAGIWNGGQAKTLGYRIRSIDRQKNQSAQFSGSVEVSAPPPSAVTSVLAMALSGVSNGAVSIGDTVGFVVRYSNPSRNLRKVAWFVDGGMDSVRVKSDSTRNGSDTLLRAWNTPGDHHLLVNVIDDAGTVWSESAYVVVELDAPTAHAGADTTVSVGDEVRLSGAAENAFGAIAKWEWDIGNTGNFAAAPDGSVSFAAPSAPDTLYCVLRVTDDDGLTGLDTLLVRVKLDPPKAMATAIHNEVFVGEPFVLSTRGSSDSLGRIVKWEWDIGKRGVFVPSSGSDTQLTAGSVPDSNFRSVLRVTDDDGNSATAEVRVIIHDRSGWINVSGGNPFADLSDLRAWVFGGKVWIAGNPNGEAWQVWNSQDMQNWKRVEPLSAPDNFPDQAPFQVFGGSLWGMRSQEVWSSQDMANWQMSSSVAGFAEKNYRQSAVFGGRIWLFDAFDNYLGKPTNDIWSSDDGVAWTKVADSTALGHRFSERSCVKDGKLWVYGGLSGTGDSVLNDVWSSSDGAHWTKATGRALAAPSNGPGMLAFKGELWLFGGADANNDAIAGAWHSPDGVTWSQTTARLPDHIGTVLEFQNRMWMFSAYEKRDHSLAGEIWLAP